MNIFAEIMSGHRDLSDVVLLIGVVLAVLAAIAAAPHPAATPQAKWVGSLAALAVGCIAFGLLAL
jgi:hypothetical protein